MKALVAKLQSAGFADVQGQMPLISIEGTWQGERMVLSQVVDGPWGLEQFFESAARSTEKLVCMRDHNRQTWESLGLAEISPRPRDLAPCAEVDCSQGVGFDTLRAGGVELKRNGEPGSTTWVRAASQ